MDNDELAPESLPLHDLCSDYPVILRELYGILPEEFRPTWDLPPRPTNLGQLAAITGSQVQIISAELRSFDKKIRFLELTGGVEAWQKQFAGPYRLIGLSPCPADKPVVFGVDSSYEQLNLATFADFAAAKANLPTVLLGNDRFRLISAALYLDSLGLNVRFWHCDPTLH